LQLAVAIIAFALVTLQYVEIGVLQFPVFGVIAIVTAVVSVIVDRGARQTFATGMAAATAVDGQLLAFQRLYHDGPPSYVTPVFAMARLAYTPTYWVDGLHVTHIWYALFIGWLSGLFARFIRMRRMRESDR
jgi:hypothetical protein